MTKRYGSAPALSEVSFTASAGEVHALIGMNGAGKSTLVKILVGAEQPDSGELSLDGRTVTFGSTRAAGEHGIAVVAQDLNVFEHLTVLANLFLMREPRRAGLVDTAAMRARGRRALARVGLDIDPRTPVSALAPADRQRVAIARALLFDPRVLVLDEPTSALQARETERLLELVRELRDSGAAIVYVSHFLQDVFSIADRVTVLRDGRAALAGIPAADTTLAETVRVMAGDVEPRLPPPSAAPRANVPTGISLEVDRLTLPGAFEDVSFRVAGGEILGLAGLEGSGAREVVASLFGATPATSGRAILADGRIIGRNMTASVRRGVAYVPPDRQSSGVMMDASVVDNLLQVRVATLGRGGFLLTRRSLTRRAARRIEQLGIKVDQPSDRLGSLSGGNQQKVLLGKWLEADASVFLLDDPTAAVDVHARADIHAVIRALADSGAVVVVASSDTDELIQLCDRVGVLYQGRLRGVVAADDLTTPGLLEAVNTGETLAVPGKGTSHARTH
ncbi:sugar ABC transporter ATP-binding protein [Microbacterium sp. RD1]|uniref:sugar ABC transporter ATP-binding protein n=1 Tax=Microbacterium sp. RD1 TaxID=3457313 RepID=UPI003FA5CDAD